ncbi:MAG: 3-deoxy-7-phosphoheptulonate synthase, partial [Pseudomonadota bacterium]
MTKVWSKDSWRGLTGLQMPEYTDQAALDVVLGRLGTYPPLVFAGEARRLRAKLAKVVNREAFLLQGGDCAEAF